MRPMTIAAAVVILCGGAAAASGADGTPTFAKDVAPIFYKSCAECHRPTMFAPMSLMSYEEARPWAARVPPCHVLCGASQG